MRPEEECAPGGVQTGLEERPRKPFTLEVKIPFDIYEAVRLGGTPETELTAVADEVFGYPSVLIFCADCAAPEIAMKAISLGKPDKDRRIRVLVTVDQNMCSIIGEAAYAGIGAIMGVEKAA